jgi:hypothetical protein
VNTVSGVRLMRFFDLESSGFSLSPCRENAPSAVVRPNSGRGEMDDE